MGSRKESAFPKRSEAKTTKTARMGSKVLAALVTILVVVEAARIRRESGDCDKITLEHQECVKVAYVNYVATHGAGDDGRRLGSEKKLQLCQCCHWGVRRHVGRLLRGGGGRCQE